MRHASAVVADVTTLNFNLMFEIGFAIGLGLPVIPIRDTSYVRDKRLFEQLGLLDTLGYVDFANTSDLVDAISARLPAHPLPEVFEQTYVEAPLYLVKTPANTEGNVQLLSAVKKSALRFRAFDPAETHRLTMHEARRQIARSVTVIAHLASPNRDGGTVHNARAAFLAGLATSQQKVVLMLQEEETSQPIDYRDLVKAYASPSEIPVLLEPVVRRTVENIQSFSRDLPEHGPSGSLERLDLGDVAAENEISGLRRYFVPTGQSRQAERGHARLVVGRKGAGKTAIFYEVRQPLMSSRSRLVLDLKPEGPQFVRLRELLEQLTPGLQQHTMMAFWTYILLAELARKILDEYQHAKWDPSRLGRYEAVEAAYAPHNVGFDMDFSQRLLREVERIADGWATKGTSQGAAITELVFSGDVRRLRDPVSSLSRGEGRGLDSHRQSGQELAYSWKFELRHSDLAWAA
jgi:nucleoside 2-deoxyribosyltransferase